MTDDQIARIANAVHDRLMNGPIKEIRSDIRGMKADISVLKADMKQVKESVEHISDSWDNWQGGV